MRRLLSLALRGTAQGPPVAGVLAGATNPAGGLLLYWAESVLLLLGTALLLALFARRGGSPKEIQAAGIRTRDVLLVHGGAFAVFGLFFGLFLVILVGKGHVDAAGLRGALGTLPWIALFVGAELAVDLFRLPSATAADLARRVDAGTRRFVLFWFVGFFGVFATILFGQPLAIFVLFAALKLLFELGAALARATPPAPAPSR